MTLAVHFICCIALFVQVITCQHIGNSPNGGLNGLQFGANFANGLGGPGLGRPGLGGADLMGPGFIGSGSPGLLGNGLTAAGLGGSDIARTGRASGGGFAVTSTSPISPTGVSILAENLAIEGPLSVGGQLPFLGTVGLEGSMQATGSGTVSYGCGTGNVGINSDAGSQFGQSGQYSQGLSGQYGAGLAGQGFGANLAGYNPGFSGAFGAGLNGPGQGFNGNGLGANLAGSGLGIGAGAAFK